MDDVLRFDLKESENMKKLVTLGWLMANSL